MERTTSGMKAYEMVDQWFPACGGKEIEFKHYGTRWLYVYNPVRDEHGYLNLDTDIVQPDAPWTK